MLIGDLFWGNNLRTYTTHFKDLGIQYVLYVVRVGARLEPNFLCFPMYNSYDIISGWDFRFFGASTCQSEYLQTIQ